MHNFILICGWFLIVLVNCGAATPAAQNATGEAPENRSSVDLSGEWEFRIDPLDVGRAEKWFDEAVPYESKMPVPGAWNAMGAEYPSEQLRREYEQKFLNGRNLLGPVRESEKLFHVYPGPAWYRKAVTIPPEWKGRIPWRDWFIKRRRPCRAANAIPLCFGQPKNLMPRKT